MKLFEPRGDEFTQWCTDALGSLKHSVDSKYVIILHFYYNFIKMNVRENQEIHKIK